jgi:DNA-directed RNA polymerase II subunit RPB4
MLQQTLTYLDNFARFSRNETIQAVEGLLSSCTYVAKFERAQLGMDFRPDIFIALPPRQE